MSFGAVSASPRDADPRATIALPNLTLVADLESILIKELLDLAFLEEVMGVVGSTNKLDDSSALDRHVCLDVWFVCTPGASGRAAGSIFCGWYVTLGYIQEKKHHTTPHHNQLRGKLSELTHHMPAIAMTLKFIRSSRHRNQHMVGYTLIRSVMLVTRTTLTL